VSEFTTEELERWIDRHAYDKAGRRIGSIADVYVDDATGKPEWLAVVTGLFGSRISFVPLHGASDQGEHIQVAWEKSMVKDSPNMDVDGQLSEEEEERLFRHYGLTYAPTASSAEVIDTTVAELQEAGSAGLNADFSPEVAQARLRKREEAEAIDLTENPAESESTK
jgi:hypothetical protein